MSDFFNRLSVQGFLTLFLSNTFSRVYSFPLPSVFAPCWCAFCSSHWGISQKGDCHQKWKTVSITFYFLYVNPTFFFVFTQSCLIYLWGSNKWWMQRGKGNEYLVAFSDKQISSIFWSIWRMVVFTFLFISNTTSSYAFHVGSMCFNILPFGLAMAPRVFSKCLAPLVAYLHLQGCHMFPYLFKTHLLHINW